MQNKVAQRQRHHGDGGAGLVFTCYSVHSESTQGMLIARFSAFPSLFCLSLLGGAAARASDCEEAINRHMTGQALLAAHYVAAAERSGSKPAEINTVLKRVAAESAIEEFWITDSSGRAYLTNTGVDFTFSPDPAKQPQASAFWALIDGSKKVVVQEARKREIDDRVFKYVAVAGIDKPRIVQIGVGASSLPICR